MSYIAKPSARHPLSPKNDLGLTRRDYEGAMSTLCAGCGHDSVTAAIVQAFFELSVPPDEVCKMSGIGCSSKTPGYFLKEAHGFNSVHGRMPSVTTGANAAGRGLTYIGVSGDGDTASIGLGQFAHAIRRGINMLYVIENNGVYGLTKGQFSATADQGSRSKGNIPNKLPPIDPVLLAIELGAGFVARSFSGDKDQLVPLIKAGLAHKGFALIDVISPCVTFNNHEGSTRSYRFTREHEVPLNIFDHVGRRDEIKVDYAQGAAETVTLHDQSVLSLRKMEEGYDPTDPIMANQRIKEAQKNGEVLTGLLYLNRASLEFHDELATPETNLRDLGFGDLVPGQGYLDSVFNAHR